MNHLKENSLKKINEKFMGEPQKNLMEAQPEFSKENQKKISKFPWKIIQRILGWNC